MLTLSLAKGDLFLPDNSTIGSLGNTFPEEREFCSEDQNINILKRLSQVPPAPGTKSLADGCLDSIDTKKDLVEINKVVIKAISESSSIERTSELYSWFSKLLEKEGEVQRADIACALGRLSRPDVSIKEAPTLRIKRKKSLFTPPEPEGMINQSVLFAPVSTAGNSCLLAEYLKSRGINARTIDYFPNYLGYKADIVNKGKSYEEIKAFSQKCLRIAEDFDVIVFDFGCSFQYLPAFNLNLSENHEMFSDIAHLKEKGKTILICFWGSDCFCQSHLHYYYLKKIGIKIPEPPMQTRLQYFMIQKLSSLADGFLAPPHYLPALPRIVPFWDTCLNLEKWSFKNRFNKKIKKIISAPTNKRKKNYDIINCAIQNMKEKHPDIEHLTVQGIPHDQVRSFLEQADLAMPQATSHFGLLTLEFMALGVPVMVSMSEVWPGGHRELAPIINYQTIDELSGKLDSILSGDTQISQLHHAGREYVEKYHSVDTVGKTLIRYIEEFYECGRIKEVFSSDYVRRSNIWIQQPEEVSALKYFDISVPAFCALRQYEQALVDCSEAVVNGYRSHKFQAWEAAINIKLKRVDSNSNQFVQRLLKEKDRKNIEMIRHFHDLLDNANGLLLEIESCTK